MKTKINIPELLKVVPKWQGTFAELCAEIIMHFGRAVECVKQNDLEIHNGRFLDFASSSFDEQAYDEDYCDGLPIRIARAFVCYLGWVKKESPDEDWEEFGYDDNNILSDIAFLCGIVLESGKFRDMTEEFTSFAKAHKIPLVEAVEIVLGELNNDK